MKEDMSLSNLGTVALYAAKVPTNVFYSTLICILTLDYFEFGQTVLEDVVERFFHYLALVASLLSRVKSFEQVTKSAL